MKEVTPSKQWMSYSNDRLSEEYKLGVEEFLNFAFKNSSEEPFIQCSCVKCLNTDYRSREVVQMHLFVHGIVESYTTWYHHGERFNESSSDDEESESEESDCNKDIRDILHDLYPSMDDLDKGGMESGSSIQNKSDEEPNDEARKFFRLLKDSELPTYPGCKDPKLYILVNLLHIKSIGRWSNESFDMLLKLLKKMV